jgi:hypothetical protein
MLCSRVSRRGRSNWLPTAQRVAPSPLWLLFIPSVCPIDDPKIEGFDCAVCRREKLCFGRRRRGTERRAASTRRRRTKERDRCSSCSTSICTGHSLIPRPKTISPRLQYHPRRAPHPYQLRYTPIHLRHAPPRPRTLLLRRVGSGNTLPHLPHQLVGLDIAHRSEPDIVDGAWRRRFGLGSSFRSFSLPFMSPRHQRDLPPRSNPHA